MSVMVLVGVVAFLLILILAGSSAAGTQPPVNVMITPPPTASISLGDVIVALLSLGGILLIVEHLMK